jgi:DNA-binding protein
MKKISLLLLAGLLQSCWICPERHNLEFEYDTKIIKVLSEGYYIESIKITEYIPKEGYVDFIDSNYVEIKQNGKLLSRSIDLRNLNKNYSAKGIDIKKILSKKEIAFEIMIKNPKLKIEDQDSRSFIYFVTDSLTKGKLIVESNGCK